MKLNIILPAIVAIVMLFMGAFLRLPYDYYTILKFVVCGISIYLAYVAYQSKKQSWIWIMGIIAVVFNPIAKVVLSKGTWVYVDVIAAIIFGVSAYFLTKENK